MKDFLYALSALMDSHGVSIDASIYGSGVMSIDLMKAGESNVNLLKIESDGQSYEIVDGSHVGDVASNIE